MAGARRLQLAGLALLGGASALQLQMQVADQQAPLIADAASVLSTPPPSTAAASASKKPLVETEALQDTISADNLLVRAKELYEIAKLGEEEFNHPTRVIGSDGHTGTLEYIYFNLAKLGDYYKIWNQTFPAVSGNVYESRLVIGDQVPKSASPMALTPPTKDKEPVHGDLVYVENDGCDASDYPSGVSGNIAFIRRGTCSFGTKSEQAGKAGAVAAVVYNYESETVHGTLGTPSPNHVATFGLGGDDAKPILEKLRKGDKVDAIAYIDAVVSTILTTNILAQTLEGDQDNCVMLGGHSDSVTDGPGINDDGSGSLSLLEIATQLTKFRVNNCVRFAWWAGEEEGLLGSDYYVSVLSPEENQKIRLFMDYDMLGSPNYAYQIYNATNAVNPTGSEELRDLYVDWYKAHDLAYTFIPFDGRSDYDAFIRNGIPGGGIATGAEGVKTKEEAKLFGGKAGDWYDPCYHQLCDDVSNVNLTAWEINTKLVSHSVATYAVSFKGFPERTKASAASLYAKDTKYHGSKLFI
ncbi:Putative PA domain, peptidase M28, PA domain superfamily [Colletotrichum destructivum]|uniref:Peptide hydrolase n=1 Tax=Colletotrichum destructivum TaxID=34406 RepID=A0AAX4IUU5_9PEZI|nr:Putative PA domain, peptidase M28, PA domain superfamily [Colletotrichum destructivum]